MGRRLEGLSYTGSDSLTARYGGWPKTVYCPCGKPSKFRIEGIGEVCYDCAKELATWEGFEWVKDVQL